MLDYVIRNGLVVDGTGAPGFRADVGIRDGMIVAVGTVTEDAATELDADGLVVAPGIIDPHTHYDAQLFWDPTASPSNLHGVTTVIAGNCGFTLAPIKAQDHDYIRQMMAKVEGMPLVALETGIEWDWTTFAEYLGRLEGNLGVNAGFLVGHCAIRRWVMGADRAAEVANDDEVAAMATLLAESIEAGGLGFSSSQSRTHSDGDGNPISSRYADRREMLAFCEVVRDHPGTTLEYITNGCLDTFSDEEIDLMVAMTTTARRPLNWNLLTVDSRTPDKTSPPARGLGGRGRGRGQDHRPDHAHPGAHEHELPHPLRPVPDSGLGRRHGTAGRAADREAARPGSAGPVGRAGPLRGRRCVPAPVPLGQLHHRRHVRPRERRLQLARRRLDRRGAGQGALRRPPRPRHRRRPAHRAVAQGLRRRRRLVGGQGRGVERPGRPGRRVGRRCPPRPDVRLQLPDLVPRRLPAQPQARADGAGRALDDPGPGRPVRTERPRPGGRGSAGRPLRVRPGDGGLRTGHPGRGPARRQPTAHRRLHRRGPGPGQRDRDRRRRADRPATCRAPCCVRARTPSPWTRRRPPSDPPAGRAHRPHRSTDTAAPSHRNQHHSTRTGDTPWPARSPRTRRSS